MSNHIYVILHIDGLQELSSPTSEIIERWHSLHKGNLITQRYLQGEPLIKAELDAVEKYANLWRERLMSISWFMRRLNESIARKANEEDACTGYLLLRPSMAFALRVAWRLCKLLLQFMRRQV